MQSLNCVRKYLSLFIAFAGLPLLTFTLSSHTKALAWVQHLLQNLQTAAASVNEP